MAVSVPEKTVEHWASQYILYRFRSNVAMWWPAAGGDVHIPGLRAQPGDGVRDEPNAATWRRLQHSSELAFSRGGAGLWFADWMVVMTTQDVAASMAMQ